MDIQDMNIKEKALEFVSTIEKNDNDDGYNYFEGMISSSDPDYIVLKEKMDNLMILLKDIDSKGEMDAFNELDFEEDIWDMI